MDFINLSLDNKPYKQAILDAVQRVLSAGVFIGGEEVELFEQEFANYLGIPHVVSCANGTDALFLALKALGITQGDEVIVPAFTYVATANVIAHLGATPVFCDVDQQTYTLDVAEARKKITAKTKAIIPVHLFGQMANMDEVMTLAKEHDLFVIEDCAQSTGATWNGKQSGTFGHINTFSFFPTKNLGCYGDGGAISTNDAALAEKIRLLKLQGQTKKYHHEMLGHNSRLDTIQAAILRVKLPYLPKEIAARQAQAKKYDEQFSSESDITIPFVAAASGHSYNQYTIQVPNRDALIHKFEEQGIPTMIYYPEPLHTQPCFAYLGYTTGDFPISEQLCNTVLSLPILLDT